MRRSARTRFGAPPASSIPATLLTKKSAGNAGSTKKRQSISGAGKEGRVGASKRKKMEEEKEEEEEEITSEEEEDTGIVDVMTKSDSDNDDGGDGDGSDDNGNSKFASTLLSLVKEPASAAHDDGGPQLVKRKTRELKEIEVARREARAAKVAKLERREKKLEGMVEPGLSDIAFERQLRKVATRGVVMLFNKIQERQLGSTKPKEKVKAKPEVDAKEVSKGEFLNMIKSSKEGNNSSNWGALQDEYDFEGEDENEEEEEGFELEVEDDDDSE